MFFLKKKHTTIFGDRKKKLMQKKKLCWQYASIQLNLGFQQNAKALFEVVDIVKMIRFIQLQM